MASITIHFEDEADPEEVVRHVADMISDGFTSGYAPHWTLQ